jgi:hypothetical protein
MMRRCYESNSHTSSSCTNETSNPQTSKPSNTKCEYLRAGCDPTHQSPKPGSAYRCPSCRRAATPKKGTSLQNKPVGKSPTKRLKAPASAPGIQSEAVAGSPFRSKVQPPTLVVEDAAADLGPDGLRMNPSLGVGELGLTPGTMARLGLDTGFGTASFAEEQQELEADSELAMLLRSGSDVDLTTIGGGLLGSLQSPEGLAILQSGALDGVAASGGGVHEGGQESAEEGGERTTVEADAGGSGSWSRQGSAKMAAFKVPPLIVNSFVSPGASSGSPFGLLFSQRSDQVALPNFLPGQLDTPNVTGSSLWGSPPVEPPAGNQLAADATAGRQASGSPEAPPSDAAQPADIRGSGGLGGLGGSGDSGGSGGLGDLGGSGGLEEPQRGSPLSAEERQKVRERLSQLDAPTQLRLQRFLEAEKAKQEAQSAQVESFMQKHSRIQAEREGGAHRLALSPPSRGQAPPHGMRGFGGGSQERGMQPLLISPGQNAFLPMGAEQTYLRPDSAEQHPLLSPPISNGLSAPQETLNTGSSVGFARSNTAQQPAEIAGYWEGRPLYREPPPNRVPFPGDTDGFVGGRPAPGAPASRPLSPAESQGRQIELAKRMATNANAAETFLKKLPAQLAKELSDRFPDGVPPSVLSAIAQHLVRVSALQQHQTSPHVRNPQTLRPELGASPLSPAGVPYPADKNALAALQMPPPTSVPLRSPRLQMNVGGGNGMLRGQALRNSPTFLAQWKRGGEKGQPRGAAPWSGPYGGPPDPSVMMARMAAAKRSINQVRGGLGSVKSGSCRARL